MLVWTQARLEVFDIPAVLNLDNTAEVGAQHATISPASLRLCKVDPLKAEVRAHKQGF